ncbi:MAG: type II toxin-antitoxin system RelE/ParE family toxin [Alphaproteobacteria bacterium]|nr:type II toxin-antitoxin system RelE/ParE family toxin [Alphaproteobacteria bacterium]
MDYTLSPLADDDLDEIWLHIAQDNEPAADGMIRKIFETISLITEQPLMGRARDELRPRIRSLAVSPYIIFYRPEPDMIEIVRVLHHARDVDAIFH